MFCELMIKLNELATINFDLATANIIQYIDNCDDFIDILKQIGMIPESIICSSTAEKLFSKASDAVLARAFREIGLKATVLTARADSADVHAESIYHGYTLVADAKSFRLSRTAKNQKDFKIEALSSWRKNSDFAVLCSPYFQYPVSKSQIYAQAMNYNVCLLSWEHLIFLIENKIKESVNTNFSSLWNVSEKYAERCLVADMKNCFIPVINQTVLENARKNDVDFKMFLKECQSAIVSRAEEATSFWEGEIVKISSYTREEAITELLKIKNIDEKIAQIKKYVAGIKKYDR